MRLRVSFLRVGKVRELGRIAHEKYWRVVEDPVQVPLFRADFHRKASRVACSVGRARFPSDCGETNGSPGLVADLAEERRAGKVSDVMRDLEVPVCAGTIRMDDALRNAFVVKMGEEVDVVEI